jgi:uncharacterized RDD family membrane protein YckC
MQWYYAIDGERRGPVAQAEFEKLVTDGVVKADTLVWQQGMAEWQPYARVAGGPAAGAAPAAGADDGTEVCAVSGQRHPRREMINYAGKWISAEHRDAFFQRKREGVVQPDALVQQQREGVVRPEEFVFGNFWPRFCAKLLDGLILAVVGVVINVVLGSVILGNANYFGGVVQAAGTAKAMYFQIVSNLVGVLLGVGYAWFFISRYSATPGKMALGLKLVRADGSPLSTGRIIGRYFAEWLSGLILLIGYIMAAWDPERRALHDRICDTRVIKVK